MLDDVVTLLALGNISLYKIGTAWRIAQATDYRIGAVFVAATNYHICTGFDKSDRSGLAHAGSTTGDQNPFPIKIETDYGIAHDGPDNIETVVE